MECFIRTVWDSCVLVFFRAARDMLGPSDFQERLATIYDKTSIIRQKDIFHDTRPTLSFFFKPHVYHVYVIANFCQRERKKNNKPPIQLCLSASNACTLNFPHQSSALHEKGYAFPIKLCIRQICKRIRRRTMTACTLYGLNALRRARVAQMSSVLR